ncbi:FadR/GntR family transcriptional regulator [Phytohabitans aurantiacus]|jgi:GntR family transcriptional repressor for pyruvate dehydrogenase complex|uniref:GntR family transcriptional regulator n=1 Tax=Phytohabitans aurantiacus TaxID=3016789 RepID=A0ABQ5QNI6_9ACTN|nr:FadR/GntR family transcriptional regulator [Phytohabitans aurantiacus]GLH96233.1 GntR family transcriptional regulator [Phytohabitans aurantiacus]
MSLTDKAMTRLREMIQSGELPAGSRLPPEQQLAAELGVGRNIMREAVRALVAGRVLEVRRGNGTFVTSLEPRVLLEGISGAVELLRGDTLLELTEVRRLFESAATALAATRISARQLAEVKDHLDAMRAAADDVELLNQHDAAFHRAVVAATGNETLSTVLEGISSRTLRARVWRGLVDADAAGRTLREHEAIYAALATGDAIQAQAAALMHITTTETWLRAHLHEDEDAPAAA